MTSEEFNKKVPVGTPVIYTDDFGVGHATKTRSEAWELGHGDAVVMLDGFTGGYDVFRISTSV